MEIAGFISIGLGAMMLLAFSLSDELAVFFPGYTPLILGAIMVIAGLVLLFVCELIRKKRIR
jgi:hypothetical protein